MRPSLPVSTACDVKRSGLCSVVVNSPWLGGSLHTSTPRQVLPTWLTLVYVHCPSTLPSRTGPAWASSGEMHSRTAPPSPRPTPALAICCSICLRMAGGMFFICSRACAIWAATSGRPGVRMSCWISHRPGCRLCACAVLASPSASQAARCMCDGFMNNLLKNGGGPMRWPIAGGGSRYPGGAHGAESIPRSVCRGQTPAPPLQWRGRYTATGRSRPFVHARLSAAPVSGLCFSALPPPEFAPCTLPPSRWFPPPM